MLLPDLLNTLFDQSNYSTLVSLCALNKRKTAYANKYSSLNGYEFFGANIITKSIVCMRDIDYICKLGKLKMIKHVINERRKTESKILHFFMHRRCVKYGHLEIVKYLINFVVSDDMYLRDAMSISTKYGHLQVVKYLLNISKSVRIDIDLDESLTHAVRGGHLETIKYFVGAGANVMSDVENVSLFEFAASHGNLQVVQYLRSIGCGKPGDMALMCSADKGSLPVTKYLVEQGWNTQSCYDKALICAAPEGHLDVVKYLVDKGADIHTMNDDPLIKAITSNKLDVVKFLTETSGTIHEYALQFGIISNSFDVVKYLIGAGADIHAIDNGSWKHVTNKCGSEMVKYLRKFRKIQKK